MSDFRERYEGENPTAMLHLKPMVPGLAVVPSTLDPLSDPDPDDLADQIAALLPLGHAWRTPDGAAFDHGGKMGALLRAFAEELAVTYRRAYRMTLESTAVTLIDSLEDWETDHGLPDPCLEEDGTAAARRLALITKIRSLGTITPQDFINLAARLGIEITITEPRSFEFGVSQFGWQGFEPVAEFYWIVKPTVKTAFYFEFGVSQFGVDRFSDFIPLRALECLFRSIKPAWTMVIFDYS